MVPPLRETVDCEVRSRRCSECPGKGVQYVLVQPFCADAVDGVQFTVSVGAVVCPEQLTDT